MACGAPKPPDREEYSYAMPQSTVTQFLSVATMTTAGVAIPYIGLEYNARPD